MYIVLTEAWHASNSSWLRKMIRRSSGSEDLEFLRELINDHPIGDEQAVLLYLLDGKALAEVVGARQQEIKRSSTETMIRVDP